MQNVTQLVRGVVWALVVMLAASALLLNVRLINNLDLDNGIIGDEGEMLFALRAVRLEQPLYRDLSTEPHILTPYMPLFYLVPGTAARWLGTGWMGTVMVGRGYVYLLWIGIGAMVCALVRQAGGTPAAVGLAALLWLMGFLTPEVANSFRPDSAAIFFSLAGVWLYRRAERTSHFLCSSLLLVVAFLHKHSAVCAMLAIVVDALWQRRWKTALAMAGAWMAGVGISITMVQIVTSGAFGMNVFGSLFGWTDLQHVGIVLTLALVRGAAVFLGAGIAIAAQAVPRVLRAYFILAVVLAVGSSAKFGSGPHYYLEAYAVGCVLTGILVSGWLAGATLHGAGLRITWLAVAVGSCLIALGSRLASGSELAGEIRNHRAIRGQMTEEWERVLDRLRDIGQPQLIEDVYLAVRSSTLPVLVNGSMFASMQRSGRFDDRPLLQQIEEGRFVVIVASFALEEDKINRHFPKHWLATMRARYALAETIAMDRRQQTFFIYRPRGDGA